MNVWERIDTIKKMYVVSRYFSGRLPKYFEQYVPDVLDTGQLVDLACDDNLYKEL